MGSMTYVPGETPAPPTLQERLAAYSDIDLTATGSLANLHTINTFSYETYTAVSNAEGTEQALALGQELGDHLTRKGLQELHEQHGNVVKTLMGEDRYRAALVEKASYEALPSAEKLAHQGFSSVVDQYNYVSEATFLYMNELRAMGIFYISPTEIRSIHYRGGSVQNPNFLDRKNVTVVTAKEEGIYIAQAPFEVSDGNPVLMLSRLVLGPGIDPKIETFLDIPQIQTMRLGLTASESRRLEGGTSLIQARSIYQEYIARLEPLQELSQAELRLFMEQAFAAENHDLRFEDPDAE